MDNVLLHTTSLPLLGQANEVAVYGNDTTPHVQFEDGTDIEVPPGSSQPNESSLDLAFGNDVPSWFMDFTADLDALSSTFGSDIASFGYGSSGHPFEHVNVEDTPHPNLEQIWFTRMQESNNSRPQSHGMTPEPGQMQAEINEDYRRTLHRRLQINVLDPSLPSSDFLNLSIRSYFARFHPVYPVIHAPTFRPSKTNSLLLLSICSIGSLFTGSTHGAVQGTQIFERLNKAILATWEQLMARNTEEATPMVQAALIGQTFGLLSGDPKHLATVEAFHGVVISWARTRKMFNIKHGSVPEMDQDVPNLDAAWREWAKQEELIRLVLGLHIHDAELAAIFHHEPFLRHAKGQRPRAAEDNVFMASKPQEWLRLLQQGSSAADASRHAEAVSLSRQNSWSPNTRELSSFNAYVRLQCISAAVAEWRHAECLEESKQQALVEDLMNFHQEHPHFNMTPNADPLGISILWHLSFISLCTDFDVLEQAIGRDGPQISSHVQEKMMSWAASPEANRSIVHMQLIRKKLETLSVGLEPAIHIPRAIFVVAICWYCAFRYALDWNTTRATTPEFPEIKLLGLNSNMLLFEANGYKYGRPTVVEANEVLCRFADFLQRLGHWEIARKFASIIGALIHPESS